MRFQSMLEPSWGHLGAILGRLGVVSAPSWPVFAPSWPILAPSWSVLKPFWLPKALQASQKALKFLWFFNIFQSSNMFANLAVLNASECVSNASWSHLGGILAPSWAVLASSPRRFGPSSRHLEPSLSRLDPLKALRPPKKH